VNSNMQSSDGFIKCECTCWWAMYWGNLMILTPVKQSRITKFSLTTNMNDTGFCSVGLQTVCSYMHKRKCELPGFLYPFFSFLVWYCLKHISAWKFGFFKCLTETISYSASFRFAVATHMTFRTFICNFPIFLWFNLLHHMYCWRWLLLQV
jgi:hypothetical protein